MRPTISKSVLVKSANIFETKSGNTLIKVVFPYSQYSIDEVKSIEGKKWDATNKHWTIPLSLNNALKLNEFKYILQPELKQWVKRKVKLKEKPITAITHIDGLNGTPYAYQWEGVSIIERWDGRALLADEMGLGKTVQALMYLQLHRDRCPVIIVCPAFLKLNWIHEAKKWLTNPNIQILSGRNGIRIDRVPDIFIINYDILFNKYEPAFTKAGKPAFDAKGKRKQVEVPYTGWVDFLKEINPKVVIMDEVHYIKTSTTKRTKAAIKLCKGVPHILELSGTPLEKAPIELFNSTKILNPSLFVSEWLFKQKFCGPKHNGFGWTFKGATNIPELHKILTENVMIRRLKKDVLKDLPDKVYAFVPLEIDNRDEYEDAAEDFENYVRGKVKEDVIKIMKESLDADIENIIEINEVKLKQLQDEKAEKAIPIVQIGVLKRLAVKGKMKQAIKWIENFLESGEKLVVFAEHRFVVNELYTHFKKLAVKIDGSVSLKNRDKAVTKFQNNKQIQLFIGNKAAEVGLTLTAASNVAIIEYPDLPGPLSQRIDRLHRITQKFTVNVWYLLGEKTIEEQVIKNLNKAQKVLDGVLDGVSDGSYNMVTELIKHFKESRV